MAGLPSSILADRPTTGLTALARSIMASGAAPTRKAPYNRQKTEDPSQSAAVPMTCSESCCYSKENV